jgi:hypothetical protein
MKTITYTFTPSEVMNLQAACLARADELESLTADLPKAEPSKSDEGPDWTAEAVQLRAPAKKLVGGIESR